MENSKYKFVYVVTSKGERKFWTKVGIAFVNRDGSLNCKLDSLPVDGELHIREPLPRPAQDQRERRPLSSVEGPAALVS